MSNGEGERNKQTETVGSVTLAGGLLLVLYSLRGIHSGSLRVLGLFALLPRSVICGLPIPG